MTTQQIAQRLAELCRKGDWETVQRELFADDAISIEPADLVNQQINKSTNQHESLFH